MRNRWQNVLTMRKNANLICLGSFVSNYNRRIILFDKAMMNSSIFVIVLRIIQKTESLKSRKISQAKNKTEHKYIYYRITRYVCDVKMQSQHQHISHKLFLTVHRYQFFWFNKQTMKS